MPEVLINGPAGRIECRYTHGKADNAPIALVLHPHPQHGGTMNNKIIYSMYRTLVNYGFSTMRFNFRGVGRSQGTFDKGEGELSDAASVLDWLQTYNPNASSVWVCGFSFGAWIAMQSLMRRPEIERFIVVSPPSNLYDFSFLAPCPASGLIVQGDQDTIVHTHTVEKLVSKLRAQKGIDIDYEVIPGADHFFGAQMDQLNDIFDRYIKKNQPGPRVAA